MLPTKPTVNLETVSIWTGKALSRLPIHIGEDPATGPLPSSLDDILHTAPVPVRHHLTPANALGILTRCLRGCGEMPQLLFPATAEAFATGAVMAVEKAAKVEGPPKKPGKKPYNRAKAEAAAALRLTAAEQLLRAYLDPAVHAAAAAWAEDNADLSSRPGLFYFNKQSRHQHIGGGVSSTRTAHDSVEAADLIVVLGTDTPSATEDAPATDYGTCSLQELAEAAQATVARVGRRYALRRPTNYETLRLQGFPADHCNVPMPMRKSRKMPLQQVRELLDLNAAEGRTYTADELQSFPAVTSQYLCAGNSVAVPCMAFVLERAVDAATAPYPLIDCANDNIPEDGWPARIAAHRRAGHDTLAALAKCLEEDSMNGVLVTDGTAPAAANDNAAEIAIIMTGLGCGEDDANALLALLVA